MVWKRQVAEWKGKWVCWRCKNVGIKPLPPMYAFPYLLCGVTWKGCKLVCVCGCLCVYERECLKS